MKLIFLGSGSALTIGTDNFQSNMLLVDEANNKLLIDCGTDARFSLFKQQLTYSDITDVYISHLHADHAGGLEGLAISTHFTNPEGHKPNLFIIESLRDDIWNKTLSGGLSTISFEMATLDTFFKVHPIPVNGAFTWQNIKFKTVQTIHVMNGFSLMPCFGLLFKLNGVKILLTTDTQYTPHQLMPLYQSVDIIFHDCETSEVVSGVHAHFNELIELPDDIKAKMWLYHYNPGPLPDAVKAGFKGFVACGQCFDF